MIETQTIIPIGSEVLVERVRQMCEQHWRLVHIGATTLAEHVQLDYAFDRDGQYTALRLLVPHQGRVPSISGVYWCAFLYENEIHDLFNLELADLAVDFKGNFYQTTVKYPFATPPSPAAKPAPVAAPAVKA